jgi:hypothetical protein
MILLTLYTLTFSYTILLGWIYLYIFFHIIKSSFCPKHLRPDWERKQIIPFMIQSRSDVP